MTVAPNSAKDPTNQDSEQIAKYTDRKPRL
jgi:hypothetical protein